MKAARKSKIKLSWAALLGTLSITLNTWATPQPVEPPNQQLHWQDTLKEAQGETVYFNYWGGDEKINDYLRWASTEIKKEYGVQLKLVKVDDIATVISRILAEKSAGRVTRGSVDLVWINGENFRSLKENGLLYGPFSQQLPSMANIDSTEKPTTVADFGIPVDGMEAPWGMAQLVFLYDHKKIPEPPRSAKALLSFAKAHPGRITYPAPPDFVGTTFLKQLLTELAADPLRLQQPVTAQDFKALTQPLWDYLDQLHPLLWRKGRAFPGSSLALTPLLDDGEILLSMSFNPSYASAAIANGELSENIRTYVFTDGTLGNSHFLAIPFNSRSKAGAKVIINFLLSAKAQAHKADPTIWGDPTVLSMSRLTEHEHRLFTELPIGIATLTSEQLGQARPEPHASWVSLMEKAWLQRYR